MNRREPGSRSCPSTNGPRRCRDREVCIEDRIERTENLVRSERSEPGMGPLGVESLRPPGNRGAVEHLPVNPRIYQGETGWDAKDVA